MSTSSLSSRRIRLYGSGESSLFPCIASILKFFLISFINTMIVFGFVYLDAFEREVALELVPDPNGEVFGGRVFEQVV